MAAFAQLYLEVESGRRPHRQLSHFVTPMLAARLAAVAIPPGRCGRLLRVQVARVRPGQAEAVALVRRDDRVTALALSLVRDQGRWRVDDLARPEWGPLPGPAYPVPTDEPDVFELTAPPAGDGDRRARVRP